MGLLITLLSSSLLLVVILLLMLLILAITLSQRKIPSEKIKGDLESIKGQISDGYE